MQIISQCKKSYWSQIGFMFFMQNRISDYVYFDDAVKNGTQEWIHIWELKHTCVALDDFLQAPDTDEDDLVNECVNSEQCVCTHYCCPALQTLSGRTRGHMTSTPQKSQTSSFVIPDVWDEWDEKLTARMSVRGGRLIKHNEILNRHGRFPFLPVTVRH